MDTSKELQEESRANTLSKDTHATALQLQTAQGVAAKAAADAAMSDGSQPGITVVGSGDHHAEPLDTWLGDRGIGADKFQNMTPAQASKTEPFNTDPATLTAPSFSAWSARRDAAPTASTPGNAAGGDMTPPPGALPMTYGQG